MVEIENIEVKDGLVYVDGVTFTVEEIQDMLNQFAKSVKPERLNREYACPLCGGLFAVFGDKKNDEWRCIDCDRYYNRKMLEKEALHLVRLIENPSNHEEYVTRRFENGIGIYQNKNEYFMNLIKE